MRTREHEGIGETAGELEEKRRTEPALSRDTSKQRQLEYVFKYLQHIRSGGAKLSKHEDNTT